MLGLVVTLAVIGFLLWLFENYVPMNQLIKRVIFIVVAVAVAVWLLNVFGLLPASDIPIPRLHNSGR